MCLCPFDSTFQCDPPLHSYMETWVPLCNTVCVFQPLYFSSLTLGRMCTYISTYIYVHLTLHVCSTLFAYFHGGHGFLSVPLYVCCCHLTSGLTPWLECLYVSVHVFTSTWLPMSPQTPMHSYMETWVPLWGTVFVSQSLHFCPPTLVRICTCISTCIHVHLTPHVCFTPLA